MMTVMMGMRLKRKRDGCTSEAGSGGMRCLVGARVLGSSQIL